VEKTRKVDTLRASHHIWTATCGGSKDASHATRVLGAILEKVGSSETDLRKLSMTDTTPPTPSIASRSEDSEFVVRQYASHGAKQSEISTLYQQPRQGDQPLQVPIPNPDLIEYSQTPLTSFFNDPTTLDWVSSLL
jgi:hypothetical protein